MFKFKINDTVQLTSGKDAGKRGKILKVMPATDKVVVEGLNLYKRHLKPQGETPGSIVSLPRAINVANVALICPSCHKPTRVGFDASQEPKVRVCKKCSQVISVDSKKK